MTCPIEGLEAFRVEHWDVYSLCALMSCPECTAEPGEGALWIVEGPPDGTVRVTADYDDIPF